MRSTINISLPEKMKKRVDYLVKSNNYGSTSELFRDALRALEDSKLIEGIMISEKEFSEGKRKKLRSLKDI
jgi:putative addiction module CopG family antidote